MTRTPAAALLGALLLGACGVKAPPRPPEPERPQTPASADPGADAPAPPRGTKGP
jgi:hypothetical protein